MLQTVTPDKRAEYSRRYYLKHREKILAKGKVTRASRPPRVYKGYKHLTPEQQKASNLRRLKKQIAEHGIEQFRIRTIINRTRNRIKGKNIPCTITFADFQQYPEFCPVLGIKLVYKDVGGTGKSGPRDDSPSIDRIIPVLGYVPGNVRIISMRANTLKNNATAAELQLVLNDVAAIEAANIKENLS